MIGVHGTAANGIGVAGGGGPVGVVGYTTGPGLAGYFLGNVHVEGTLTKGAERSRSTIRSIRRPVPAALVRGVAGHEERLRRHGADGDARVRHGRLPE